MSMPYFALYPVDFLADVGHLGNTELGIYWRLLLVYYRDGRPLPCDSDRLRRIAMAFSPEECRILDAVVSEFFVMSVEPDGTRVWRNRRADREIERALKIYANKVGGAEKARAARAARQAAGGVVGAGAEDVPQPDGAGQSDNKSDISADAKTTSTGESEPEPEPDSTKSGEGKASGPALPQAPAGYQETLKALVSEGVNAQHAVDWLKVRAKSKAPLTETAWSAMAREAAAAGITFADAVRICAERGWRGFKAEYVRGNGTKASTSRSLAGMNYSEGIDEHGNIL